MTEAPIILDTFALSHFCENARWALDHKGIAYREQSWAPMLHMFRTWRLKRTYTPVLRIDGEIIQESAAICAYLEQRFPEPVLIPAEHREADWTSRQALGLFRFRQRPEALGARLGAERGGCRGSGPQADLSGISQDGVQSAEGEPASCGRKSGARPGLPGARGHMAHRDQKISGGRYVHPGRPDDRLHPLAFGASTGAPDLCPHVVRRGGRKHGRLLPKLQHACMGQRLLRAASRQPRPNFRSAWLTC
jgi:Glutathione S-transferase, N-terminal domain